MPDDNKALLKVHLEQDLNEKVVDLITAVSRRPEINATIEQSYPILPHNLKFYL